MPERIELELQPRLRRIGEAGRVAFWEWRVAKDRVLWSKHTRALFGVDRAPERYADFLAMIHREDQARIRAETTQCLAAGGAFELAFRTFAPNDEVRWILNRGETVLAPDGRPLEMFGVSIDITSQKRTEALLEAERAALRASEARLHAAQETAHIGIYEWDIVRDEIAWDPELRRIWGVVGDLPITYAVFKAGLHPDDLARTEAAVQQALKPGGLGAYEAEYRVINLQGGTTRWVYATGRVTFVQGRPSRLLGAAYDVSERRRVADELRESEERLRLATTALTCLVYDWNLSTGQVVRSDGLERLLGIHSEEAPETSAWWRSRMHPEDLAALAPPVRDPLHPEVATVANEYRMRHADGHWVHVKDHARIFLDAQGRAARVVGITYDISERKKAESQQQLLIDELNHRVRNTLAVITSIAAQTRRYADSLEAFGVAFEGRIQALAATHTLLSKLAWNRTRLGVLIEQQLRPYASNSQAVHISGQEILLEPKQVLNLSLVFHELATNAAKYGALAEPLGRIRVTWTVYRDQQGRRVDVRWVESGGPVVSPPDRMGFGSQLMDVNMMHEFGGGIERDYRPEGLVCTLTFPLPADAQ